MLRLAKRSFAARLTTLGGPQHAGACRWLAAAATDGPASRLATELPFSFIQHNDRPPKPRNTGLTEIRQVESVRQALLLESARGSDRRRRSLVSA